MSKLEDDFRVVRKAIESSGMVDVSYQDTREAFERITDAMQEASAILIRARFVCQGFCIHDDSMEGKVISEIDAWRKKQGLER
jgi:flavodoxin